MLISYGDESPEYGLIKQDSHIASVWAEIEKNFHTYLESMITRESPQSLAVQLSNSGFKVKQAPVDKAAILRKIFKDAIIEYEKDAEVYRKFFDREDLQEYEDDDPLAFKAALRKECPVIRNSVNSQHEVMEEWKQKFIPTTGQELLDVFFNLIKFAEDYSLNTPDTDFSKFDRVDDFNVSTLDEQEYGVVGVIGSGIKTVVLYYLNPRIFPLLTRLSMYGLYFLSGKGSFGLPSKTSEFLMISDTKKVKTRNIPMNHNYWYHYSLVILYSLRIYRLIEKECKKLGISLDNNYSFLYVMRYFEEIYTVNFENIKTMTGGDEDLTARWYS